MLYGKLIVPRAFCDERYCTRSASHLTDDSGMSGFGGMRQSCSVDTESMWLTERDPGKHNWVAFDFGKIVRLGYACIWNFNQTDGYKAGLRKVKVEYSVDGETYTEFCGKGYPYEFACAEGKEGQCATNLNDGKHSPLSFDGLSARYIRFVPDAQKGVGNWGGYVEDQTRFGLSAVRFYQYREEPASGAYAYALTDSAESSVTTSLYGWTEQGHSTSPETMFLSELNPKSLFVEFDFNMTVTIGGIDLVNYNDPKNRTAGIKQFKIYYSRDRRKWIPVREEPYELSIALGTETQGVSKLTDGSDIRFPAVYCRWIRLEVCGGVGEGTYGYCNGYEFRFGFSKIRFLYAKNGYFAEAARDWTELFSNYSGWTGSDGIFSVSLDGKENKRGKAQAKNVRTMFTFGDTFLGSVNPVTHLRRRADFVNNTLGYMTGTDPETAQLKFVWNRDEEGNNLAILKNGSDEYYYWMQDCLVLGDKFYVLTDDIQGDDDPNLPEGFKFRMVGVDMLTFDIKDSALDYTSQKVYKTPLYAERGKSTIYFGCGNLVNTKEAGMPYPDGYVYFYGIKCDAVVPGGQKLLVVSRVLPEDLLDFSKYRFYAGDGRWSEDIWDSVAVCDELSSEMGVSPVTTGEHKGKYVYSYMRGSVCEEIAIRIGETPYGPFSDVIPLYFAGEPDDLDKTHGKKIYHYNAKGHYHIAPEGELLISYNTNAMDYESNLSNGNIYRPRFVRVRAYK